jgi:hypothetical protein
MVNKMKFDILIGKTLDEAKLLFPDNRFRPIRIDGDTFPITFDFIFDLIDVKIIDGKISEVR